MFLLPMSCSLIFAGFGVRGMIFGVMLMCAMLAGPRGLGFRAVVYATFVVGGAIRFSSSALFGLIVLFVMLAMITEVPGRPKCWAPWEGFYEFITKTLHGQAYYTPAELLGALDEIKPGDKNLYAVHPHGILTAGWTWNMFYNSKFHDRCGKIGFLLDDNLRNTMPTFRLMCDWFQGKKRYAAGAAKSAMLKEMAKGGTLALLPGGFQEATICHPGKDRVYLKSRKGFVKYCLQYGYSITPVYTFGESDTYNCFTGLLKFRLALAKRNIPAAAMFGNPLCPLLPRRHVSLLTFVGVPLRLPQISDPAQSDVDEWHGKYVEALKALFEKHKVEAGRPDSTLEIW